MKTIGEIKEEFSAAREADWNAICQMYELTLFLNRKRDIPGRSNKKGSPNIHSSGMGQHVRIRYICMASTRQRVK